METTEAFRGLACTGCGAVHGPETARRCPDCGAPLDPTYDYGAIGGADLGVVAAGDGHDADPDPDPGRGPTPGFWAFDALLPFPAAAAVTAGEGGTPLVAADRLAGELGVDRVFIKDEARNPTGTVLDRGLSLSVTAAAGLAADGGDVEPLACASPGDAGQSMAAYAGRAGLRSYAFVPSRCAFSNKAMTNVHGGEMRVAGGRLPDAAAAIDDQLAADYHDLDAFATPYRHEAAKTVAFELAAALDAPPDAVVVPAATGELVVGLAKGFRELRAVGATDATPRVIAAQPEGCAPIAAAVEAGRDAPEPWATPDTICGELEVPDPPGGALAVDALAETGGTAVTATDDEILESAVAAAANEVVEVGAAGGAAPAGAWNLPDDALDAGDTVVLVNTAAGLKTPDVLRSHLMGKGI